MRFHKVGSITGAIAEAVDAFDGTHADVAVFLGIRGSTLSYGMETNETRPGGLCAAYLDRLARKEPACAVPIASHFAALAGGVFQPVTTAASIHDLYQCSGHIAKECGEAASALINAACSERGGDYDRAERELDEAIAELVKAKAVLAAKRKAG